MNMRSEETQRDASRDDVISSGPTLEAVGITMPPSFNKSAHDGVNRRLAQYSQTHKKQWQSFATAWNGIAYRTHTALDNDTNFTNSVSRSNSPLPEERFKQEEALFSFFVCSVSALECFFYAAYCFASISKPTVFPISLPKDLKFYPKDVAAKYAVEFAGDGLTVEMANCLSSSEYVTMVDFRNVLTHRGTIPRNFYRGGDEDGTATMPSNPTEVSTKWEYNLVIDGITTRKYTTWFIGELSSLLSAASQFCYAKL